MRIVIAKTTALLPPTNPQINLWIYNHGWFLINTDSAGRDTNYLQIKKKCELQQVSETWYQQSSSPPGNICDVFGLMTTAPHEDSVICQYTTPPVHRDYFFAFLAVVDDTVFVYPRRCYWCVLLNTFSFRTTCYLLPGMDYFSYLLTYNLQPTVYPPIHFARVFRWRASLHKDTWVGGGWCWFDDVQRFPIRKWLHFGDSGKSNNMLPFDFAQNPGLGTGNVGRHVSFVSCLRCIDDKSRRI